jgi:hypothetical protein
VARRWAAPQVVGEPREQIRHILHLPRTEPDCSGWVVEKLYTLTNGGFTSSSNFVLRPGHPRGPSSGPLPRTVGMPELQGDLAFAGVDVLAFADDVLIGVDPVFVGVEEADEATGLHLREGPLARDVHGSQRSGQISPERVDRAVHPLLVPVEESRTQHDLVLPDVTFSRLGHDDLLIRPVRVGGTRQVHVVVARIIGDVLARPRRHV